jgi:transcriptional regulator with XRE-family HTH domain
VPDDARARRIRLVFGARVRDMRQGLGLSQTDVAARAGVSLTYVSQIERGTRNPTLAVLIQLSRALGTNPETLIAELDRVV